MGGEKGDAFINFSSDDDARQAMMKSGQIYGNPIRLYLSSRAEMQEVISRARASSMTKSLSTNNETLIDPSMSNPNESNGNAPATSMTKLSLPHPLNSLLNDYQNNKFPPAAPMVDPNNPLFLAAAQNATTPLAIQQLLAALNDKSSNSFPNYPFPLNMMNNPLQNFLPPASATTNGTLPPQYLTALQQQQQQTAALLFPNAPTPSTFLPMPTATTNAEEFYVRVRNIPVAYSYYNIKGLFGKYKLHLSDMKIINDQNGQRTGEIVLRLHSHQDLLELLAQDGRIPCFNAMLDIKKIDEYTFASSIDSFVPAHAKKTPGMTVKNCIRVTGLPKKYERKDVKRFFAGCNVTNRPGGIFIEADKINGPTFVEFETEIDAEKAFFYNGEQIGSSVIEMYRMTKADMENEINSLKRTPASDRTGRRPPLLSHEPSSTSINADSSMICLRMKNIPYTSTEQQIYEYFANNSTPIESCKLLRDRFNRGAGEALIRFHDPQSCQRAYETTNRKTFHGRSLDLRPLSNYEYQTASITPTLTSNDRQSPSSINAHFPSGGMKRPGTFFERADDDRRSDKRARWDPNQKGKGRAKSNIPNVFSLSFNFQMEISPSIVH